MCLAVQFGTRLIVKFLKTLNTQLIKQPTRPPEQTTTRCSAKSWQSHLTSSTICSQTQTHQRSKCLIHQTDHRFLRLTLGSTGQPHLLHLLQISLRQNLSSPWVAGDLRQLACCQATFRERAMDCSDQVLTLSSTAL